jgi:hypothetical protein
MTYVRGVSSGASLAAGTMAKVHCVSMLLLNFIFSGGAMTIAHSFTRTRETDFKKQGMLSLTVADSADDDQMAAGDRITLVDIEEGGSGQESKRTYIEEMRKASHGKLGLILPLVNGRLCG